MVVPHLWICWVRRLFNKHAEHHFLESGHPYSMELATLRVWSYADGEFAHRVDLLDCPSSPHLCRPWKRRIPSEVSYEPTNPSEKHPKKATMIGEEYEVLLQSALEDQSQHYEGEISRLQAELTAEQIDSSQLTIDEMREVAMLREEIHQLRSNIEHSGNELLELQSQERGHRETSQRLLREQQVAQDLLKSMREECAKERDHRQRALEELEQQIADLTANQRMMQQFTRDGELANAHIWGTSGTPGRQGKKGKKFRKNGRR